MLSTGAISSGVPSAGDAAPSQRAQGAAGEAKTRPVPLPSLTGLRWTAALMVFFYHLDLVEYIGGRAGSTIRFAFGAGNTGVSFFFVLSGFVLAWSTASTPTGRGIVRFWRRRFARVYPLHLATALGALALAYTLAPGTKPSVRSLLANLFLVQAWVPDVHFYGGVNPVSWSLACEAFFYLTFPLLVWPLRRLGWRASMVAAAACTITTLTLPMLVASFAHPDWAAYDFPLARLPEFILGIALAELVRAGRWRGPGLTLSVALTMGGYFLSSQAPHYRYQYAACTLIGFAALIAAAAQADLRGEPSPWRGRLSVKLGEISFAFYMVHILVIRTGEYLFRPHPKLPWWPSGLLVSGTAFAVSLAIAWALHTVVENPGRKLLLRKWGSSSTLK
ncbi:acyltransferase family protein [Streptomyces sp. NPDC001373]|uniref:acyltransferase family protein n=1 Tax=Streptomyces sp. NPDC001373 TaxID=3364565 RepID=UPI00367C37B0